MPYFPLLFVSIWSASRHFLFPLTSALCSWGMALTSTACPYSNSVTIIVNNLYMTLRQVMGRYCWGFPSQLSYGTRTLHPSTSHGSILEGCFNNFQSCSPCTPPILGNDLNQNPCMPEPSRLCTFWGFSTRSPGLSASENCVYHCLSLKYLWFGSYSPTTPMNWQYWLEEGPLGILFGNCVFQALLTPNFVNVSFCLENFVQLVIAFNWHCLIFTTVRFALLAAVW